jgi:uncharacterized membrane-anchored protein
MPALHHDAEFFSMRFRRLAELAAVALFFLPFGAVAQETPQNAPDPKAVELDASMNAGLAAATRGPAQVALIDQATLQLPADEAFIPKDEGLRILRAFGNSPDAVGMVGLVVGLRENDEWIVVVRHAREGYVKDDDAKNWSAEELLTNLKDGVDQSNADRRARGFPEIEAVGWIEKPTYDSARRRLVWSLAMKRKDAAAGQATGVNYNTYALGRDGYFSLNMLTDSTKVEGLKPVAATLLASLAYNPGKRYEDFDSTTDQVAAYGLAALVGGVAAKKLGLLALGAAFFAKFAKLIIVAVAAVGAGVMKFLGRKSA